jgi:hypothetical protein
MKEVGEYLSRHSNEDFWKEALASSAQSIVARNEMLKIESNKLRA